MQEQIYLDQLVTGSTYVIESTVVMGIFPKLSSAVGVLTVLVKGPCKAWVLDLLALIHCCVANVVRECWLHLDGACTECTCR